MKDLLFFKPPSSSSRFTRSGSIYPPLGLCQLAAMFNEDEYLILDAEVEGLDEEQARQKIGLINPRLVALTVSSFSLKLYERWAKWFKRNNIIVVAGGPHPTLMPEDFFNKCPNIDWAIRGEGELVFPIVVKALLNNKLPTSGICSQRKENGTIVIGESHRVNDFAKHPFPVFHGLDLFKYWCPDADQAPMITMMTGRGCPGRCSFCSAPTLHGRKIRGWSVGQVLLELKKLANMGIREISFLDDGFTTDRKRAAALCQGIVDEGLDISWFCNARVDRLDDTLVVMMKSAGCHQVYLGLESGSQKILNKVKKGLLLQSAEVGVEILRRHDLGISAGFVIGLPGEDDNTVDQTINFASRIKPDRIQFSRFVPLPGSELGKWGAVDSSNEFHSGGTGRIERWIESAYLRCRDESWGAASL